MMLPEAISYRDPDGFVLIKNNRPLRYITTGYTKQYEHLLASGLYQRLVKEGLLIPHTEIEPEQSRYYKVLEPLKIDLISYPYEWTAGQWKQAVRLLLQINAISLGYGMILKDATPFNISFFRGMPVFIDTLSFDFYEDGAPWLAYRQFCETMLAPLSLIYFNNHLWSRLYLAMVNGMDLSFVSKNLPLRTWFIPSLLLHIHLHSKYSVSEKETAGRKSLTKEKLLLLWGMISKSVERWPPHQKTKQWLLYYEKEVVSDIYLNDKYHTVTRWLEQTAPKKVIDLGANNGMFSLLAARYAETVVAVESDHDCVEDLRQVIALKKITNIRTIWADLLQPSPGLGWNNKERNALLERLLADMVLALALIHHLCIASNLPLSFVAGLLADMTNRYAIVEFIPKSDTRVQNMLHNRKDIFPDYTEKDFIAVFEKHFHLVDVQPCKDSHRKLFLWEKK